MAMTRTETAKFEMTVCHRCEQRGRKILQKQPQPIDWQADPECVFYSEATGSDLGMKQYCKSCSIMLM